MEWFAKNMSRDWLKKKQRLILCLRVWSTVFLSHSFDIFFLVGRRRLCHKMYNEIIDADKKLHRKRISV